MATASALVSGLAAELMRWVTKTCPNGAKPRPRTARLAHQPVTRHPGLCAVLDPWPCPDQTQHADTAHNPALLIRGHPVSAVGQYRLVSAG